MKKTFEIKHLKEIVKVARFLAELTDEFKHFCFEAEMGAGKTTLINQVCKELGVLERTSSPTYSIVNEYKTNSGKHIFHFDLYRLKNQAELLDIGIMEILDSNELCFFEWPEKIKPFLDENFVNLSIEVSDTTRFITLNY